jgi:hypothetical protein
LVASIGSSKYYSSISKINYLYDAGQRSFPQQGIILVTTANMQKIITRKAIFGALINAYDKNLLAFNFYFCCHISC